MARAGCVLFMQCVLRCVVVCACGCVVLDSVGVVCGLCVCACWVGVFRVVLWCGVPSRSYVLSPRVRADSAPQRVVRLGCCSRV